MPSIPNKMTVTNNQNKITEKPILNRHHQPPSFNYYVGNIQPEYSNDEKLLEDFTRRFENLIFKENKTLYLMTTTYLNPASFPLTPERVNLYLKKTYHQLLQYLHGNPRYSQESFTEIEPQMYAFLDLPGSKGKDYKKNARSRESSYHHHSILVADQKHVGKLNALTDEATSIAFASKWRNYSNLKTMNVKKINPTKADIYRTTSYASSWARKRPFDENAMQIFPQSRSERTVH